MECLLFREVQIFCFAFRSRENRLGKFSKILFPNNSVASFFKKPLPELSNCYTEIHSHFKEPHREAF